MLFLEVKVSSDEIHIPREIRTTMNPNDAYRLSPYRAVNTLRIGYKNQ